MDYIKVSKQYPKAWSKFIEWSGLAKAWHPFDSHNQLRIIYDFFDENGIIIEIMVDRTHDPKYCYSIHEYSETDDWGNPYVSDLFLRRREAESDAFVEAFYIMEERLKNEL